MAFAATLKNNYKDLNFGHIPYKSKPELLKISLHRFYNEKNAILIAFKVEGNNEKLAHLKSNDGAIYMTLNEIKWLSHHLKDVRFSQLNRFFENIDTHVRDMISISEEFEEHYAMIPSYLQDTIYISSADADIIIALFSHVLTLN